MNLFAFVRNDSQLSDFKMNQLTGRYVVIVLSVQEGRGFIQSEKRYCLEANLNGRNIISDEVPAEVCPVFCTELVWEIEKKEIRKLRAAHVPLRIECFMLHEDDLREKIGFVLLHLRTARAVPSDQVIDLEYKWHKLLGVHADWKPNHPELSLTLSVRDRLGGAMTTPKPPTLPIGSKSDLEIVDYPEQNVSVLYIDDGFIQIGDSQEAKDKFTLSFLLETAFNFDLCQTELLFEPDKRPYHISLSFFNMEASSKTFYSDLNEPIVLNDRVMFKMNSNGSSLKEFFEQYPIITLKLHQEEESLAYAEINLKNFEIGKFLDEKYSIRSKFEQDCLFRSTTSGLVPEGHNGRKPFLSTETCLTRDGPASPRIKPGATANNACGDNIEENPETLVEQMKSEASVQTSARNHHIVKSVFTTFKDVSATNSSPSITRVTIPDDEIYYLYSLTTTFQSILWKNSSNITNGFQFRFSHPKANTILIVQCNADQITNQETILLENVICKQFFVSTPTFITALVYTYPPKILICNSNAEKLTEEFELYTKLFLAEAPIKSEKTCTYFAMIGEDQNEENIICELQINLVLTVVGKEPENYQKSCYDLEPIVLDERLAFKTLTELQTWKKEQQKRFEDRQRFIESEQLKMLKEDWERRRVDLERRLNQGIEKCRVLSEELLTAAGELELKRRAFENNMTYPHAAESIEIKVTQMMEQEMNEKLEKIRLEKSRLLDHISVLEEDKQKLGQVVRNKELEIEDMKRTTLTKEQTSNLLKELRNLEQQYRQEKTAKAFFKEQWQKAVREVHVLKSEDQKQIQMQIKKKKNELSQLSLDNFGETSDTDSEQSLVSCPSSNVNSCVY